MFQSLKYSIIVLLISVSNIVNAADINIGFVDIARVLKQAPQAEAARKKLETEFAPRDKKLIEMRKQLKNMEDEMIKDSSVMSDLIRKRKERDIISMKRDIKRTREEFNEDLNLRRNEELTKLQKMVYDVIVALAKDEKFDVILGDNIVFASKRIDVTGNVLERLRASYKPAIN